jgi:hypothetical protein
MKAKPIGTAKYGSFFRQVILKITIEIDVYLGAGEPCAKNSNTNRIVRFVGLKLCVSSKGSAIQNPVAEPGMNPKIVFV